MIDIAYVLTEDERARMNTTDTPRHERTRLYARDLRMTAQCYAVAAGAPGLRKDAARYLYAESLRLMRESGSWLDMADQIEQRESAMNGEGSCKR